MLRLSPVLFLRCPKNAIAMRMDARLFFWFKEKNHRKKTFKEQKCERRGKKKSGKKRRRKKEKEKEIPMSILQCCVGRDGAAGRLVSCTSIQMPSPPNPAQPAAEAARQLPPKATSRSVERFPPAHCDSLDDVESRPEACCVVRRPTNRRRRGSEVRRQTRHLPRHPLLRRRHRRHPPSLFLPSRLVTNRGTQHRHQGSRLAGDHQRRHRQS